MESNENHMRTGTLIFLALFLVGAIALVGLHPRKPALDPFYLHYQSNQSLREVPETQVLYYFAYGYNMGSEQINGRGRDVPAIMKSNGEWPEHWSLQVNPAVPLGRAILNDYRLNFDLISILNPEMHFASISPDPKSQVEGVLWQLDKKFIEVLDFSEGLEYKLYTRELVTVQVAKTGRTYPAMVYIAHPDATIKDGSQGKTSKRYKKALLNGAREFHLSQKTVGTIESWPTWD